MTAKGRRKSKPGVGSLEYMRLVMNDEAADPTLRLRAAIEIAKYEHTKTHDGGKKEAAKDAARRAASGKFAPAEAPKLKLVGNGSA